MKTWNELKWWNSDACAAVHGKLGWYDYGTTRRTNFQPNQSDVYSALHMTPFDQVRVVIVGQDPYHTPGFATGLAFSVPSNIPRQNYPPSLRNIFTELCNDLHIPYPKSGDLSPWAKQGVLLWNSVLTVEPGRAQSHKGLGWETLTDEVIGAVDEHCRGVVFVLWGRDAQAALPRLLPSIQNKRHRVLLSPHPSPHSAYRGFFGSRPFSTINAFLKDKIDWRL